MTKAALTGFVFLLSQFLFSTAQAQSVYIGGEGIVECGQYLKDRRENKKTQTYIYATWVRGFASGFNVATSGEQAPKIPGSDTILAYLDKHCQASPLDQLYDGAAALVKELGGTNK